jgi:hypothetical protein
MRNRKMNDFLSQLCLLGLFLILCFPSNAQISLTVKTIDEDALLAGKAWRNVDAGTDKESGMPYITYGQPSCDVSRTSGSITYNSVKWNFNKFFFDKDLNYVSTEEKTFNSSLESMSYAPVWGKKFTAMSGDMDVSHGAVGIAKSIAGDNASLGLIDASFIGKTSVTIGMKGFTPTISTVKVYSQVISGAAMSAKPTAAQLNSCWESPASTVTSSEPLKQEKGQRWVPMLTNPRPGGAHVLFSTDGVYKDATKAYYVFRNYDENANVIGEEIITFDYTCVAKGYVLETDQSVADFVILTTSLEYKKAVLKNCEPLFAEYIRVDGNTLKVKERFPLKLVNTKWTIDKAIESNGAVYLMGPASASTTERYTFDTYRVPDALPNYQVAKIESGKAAYISSFGAKELASATKAVPGIKGKVQPSMFLMQNGAANYLVKDGRVLITGQQYETADKYGSFKSFGSLVIASVSTTGKLEALYALPESQTTRGDLFFTKDNKTAYWTTYDYKPLNTFVGASVIQKKYDFIASQLRLTKIDLSAANIVSTQICGEEVYAPVNGKEVLFDSDTHVCINAKSLAKKAKDSDITLVMFEK